MRKRFMTLLALLAVFCAAARGEEAVSALTYAVFPYVPDPGYYQELIEARWAEMEPEIPLIRAEWNCYRGAAPAGIDVVMFDAVTRDALIGAGWIQPIRPEALRDAGDFFPYALEGFAVDGLLYGVPVFLCGNFLIYDREDPALAAAARITDLAGESGILVANTEDAGIRHQYAIEAAADALGEANPARDDGAEEILALLNRLAVDGHRRDADREVALAFDAGIGRGYIGFSESMLLLQNRQDRIAIKQISFSDRENTPRVYADAAAVTSGAEGLRYLKCLELIGVMADAEVLTALSVREGAPQYLLLARRSPYRRLAARFPLYAQLEALADADNHVILTP